MTYQTSVTFASAKKNRVPLARIDVRDAAVAKKLGRVLSMPADRTPRVSSFNSAL
ncbi:FxSxx-COOH cyclophane-containing RiPP peptide [Streptomyces corynorhini]|uniref:FXSXX-COOH protein n=1 Tax=Streptomyces corynorhini TaxID=2282652 RepID=A0A370B5U2_9ACTN|nr:FxSxx-COOH cyclophane-containing RiPP peptide [Streptomyces corynorhini]RDG35729.1 FXSXX-COOH protein [Streptomyces corynorhini]